MSYKISGNITSSGTIYVINESAKTIESYNTVSPGSYEITVNTNNKTIVARSDGGGSLSYGDVSPAEFDATGNNAVIAGGRLAADVHVNTINHMTISITSTAIDFGDLTETRYGLGATSNGSNDRGVFLGGRDVDTNNTNTIDYITLSSPSDATDFGDMGLQSNNFGTTSNATNNRGVFRSGGYDSYIRYITISSAGNSSNFGSRLYGTGADTGLSNGTNERGLFAGGQVSSNPYNYIEYITINSPSTAQDFGDLTEVRKSPIGCSNSTNDRGVFAGGINAPSPGYTNVIDYVTITSTGDASDFGDLITYHYLAAATSNGTSERGLFISGSTINLVDYITISTTSNSSEFTELMDRVFSHGATSNA